MFVSLSCSFVLFRSSVCICVFSFPISALICLHFSHPFISVYTFLLCALLKRSFFNNNKIASLSLALTRFYFHLALFSSFSLGTFLLLKGMFLILLFLLGITVIIHSKTNLYHKHVSSAALSINVSIMQTHSSFTLALRVCATHLLYILHQFTFSTARFECNISVFWDIIFILHRVVSTFTHRLKSL